MQLHKIVNVHNGFLAYNNTMYDDNAMYLCMNFSVFFCFSVKGAT